MMKTRERPEKARAQFINEQEAIYIQVNLRDKNPIQNR